MHHATISLPLPEYGPERPGLAADDVQVTCLACAQGHLVNPKTGRVDQEKRIGAPVLRVHTTRAKIIRSRRPFRLYFEVGGGGLFPEIGRRQGAPLVSLRTRARGRLGHSGLRNG
jgi:hypothetical protein